MKHFLNRVLEAPYYGYTQDNKETLYIPTQRELFIQFFKRCNIFSSQKNWLTFSSWIASFLLVIPLYFFLFHFFSWKLALLGLFYSMVLMGSHGTLYLHRYCSHRAYKIRNSFWRFVIKNLVIKVIPEEIYAVSHLVHHKYSEKPGDPYNVNGGWLYCFLADANHNPISTTLNKKDYLSLANFMNGAGLEVNSFEKYGYLVKPSNFFLNYSLNWIFWYGVFYLLGGHPLATALFGFGGVWAFGVRTFNFDGHGRGMDKRKEGVDFNWEDKSINQVWPGYVAGEWHNNHHLFPNGARCGFLKYQLDLPWLFILFCSKLGIVTKYNDPTERFFKEYYFPYLEKEKKFSHAIANRKRPDLT